MKLTVPMTAESLAPRHSEEKPTPRPLQGRRLAEGVSLAVRAPAGASRYCVQVQITPEQAVDALMAEIAARVAAIVRARFLAPDAAPDLRIAPPLRDHGEAFPVRRG